MAIAYRSMIRTKEVTQKHIEFIPKLILLLCTYIDESDLPQTLNQRDVQYYISMLEKILMIGEYTLEEAEVLTLLTTIYKDAHKRV